MLPLTRRAIVGLFMGLLAMPAMAETSSTVHATLWDSGPDAVGSFDAGRNMGLAMPDEGAADAPMGITLDTQEVPAGDVTFKVDNTSQFYEHEMVVAAIADPSKPLPFNADANEVDEDAAGAIGEVPETAPGDSGEVTLHLAPGKYILFCNIAGHYAMGMWTLLTVSG